MRHKMYRANVFTDFKSPWKSHGKSALTREVIASSLVVYIEILPPPPHPPLIQLVTKKCVLF